MADLKKTNFVVCSCASEVEDGMYFDELWLLGWDNNTDWFCNIDSQDIMTPAGRVKKNEFGIIHTSSHEAAYVGFEQKDCQSYCDDAIKEGYDCCICRLEKDDTGAIRVCRV
jgi:hypothetical protein